MGESTKGDKRVLFVQGATATGKSQWALDQCMRHPGSCIVNCDSVQIYKHVNIGSSKPSVEDRCKVPHYLYDHVEYPDTMTAGQYERLFFSLLETIPERNIFVVGGTGFYFQAIEKGMYPVRNVSDEIKAESEALAAEKGYDFLFDWIQSRDPAYAKKISKNDFYRIERAFQLMKSENKSMTQIQSEFDQMARVFPFPLLKIGLTEDKEVLRTLVVQRTRNMLNEGLVKEVQTLLEKGMLGWEPLSSVGYKETVGFVQCKMAGDALSDVHLADEISQNTMKLIKKQKTWFQRDKQIHWVQKRDRIVSVVDSFIGSTA